jgi:uncharacterized membrane protein
VALLILKRANLLELNTYQALLLTIAVTTVCWVLTAFLGPQTDRATLIAFYRRVRPFGPGWTVIREAAGISAAEAAASARHENIPLALLGWLAGCVVVWSALFTVGSALYGRWAQTGLLVLTFAISGTVLLRVIRRLWDRS